MKVGDIGQIKREAWPKGTPDGRAADFSGDWTIVSIEEWKGRELLTLQLTRGNLELPTGYHWSGLHADNFIVNPS